MEFCITPTQQLKTYTRILLTNLVETGKHTMKTVSLLFTIPKLSDFILNVGMLHNCIDFSLDWKIPTVNVIRLQRPKRYTDEDEGITTATGSPSSSIPVLGGFRSAPVDKKFQ